jgi:hypothetical protein
VKKRSSRKPRIGEEIALETLKICYDTYRLSLLYCSESFGSFGSFGSTGGTGMQYKKV